MEPQPHPTIVLLPCHGLEDFPFHFEGAAADDLLHAYTAAWHPELIIRSQVAPTWGSAYRPSEELSGKLVILPRVCRDDLPGYWADEARSHGALVVEAELGARREEISAAASKLLASSSAASREVSAETLADFHALGLCHLLIATLSVQMRYWSRIDDEVFSRHVVAAAEAALEGDDAAAHDRLAACFDALSDARCHFYPVESYLVDLTLVAPTTLGKSLRIELGGAAPVNLLLSGSTLGQMAEREGESLTALRSAIEAGTVQIVGGELDEGTLPLLPPEDVLKNLHAGLRRYEQILGSRPSVFGRRRFGLSPRLPHWLSQSSFAAALHFTLDGGRFPQFSQTLGRWEATDAASGITALGRVPLDASLSETVLSLPRHMATAMDMYHVAAVTFAHWPSQVSIFYDDLRRAARFAPTLGRFVTIDAMLESGGHTARVERFTADEYRSPYLDDDVAAAAERPISRYLERHRARASDDAKSTIATVTALLSGRVRTSAVNADAGSAGDEALLEQFVAALSPRETRTAAGCLLFNPLSFARRVVVPLERFAAPPAVGGAVQFVGEVGRSREAVVELPPLGYVYLSSDQNSSWTAPRSKPLAEDGTLRNELIEATIDPQTGGIQSVALPGRRGNQLSQRLALRRPGPLPKPGERWIDPDERACYATMQAESIEVAYSGAAAGAIESRGVLIEGGINVARFRQSTRIERGEPILWLDIELEPLVELEPDPWQHYFAARFAWADASAELVRDVGLVAEPTEAAQFEAPHYVEVIGGRGRTAILSPGLPFHRRSSDRSLDTLLIVRGESARKFQLGVGFDLQHPLLHSLSMLSPPLRTDRPLPRPSQPTAWLLHLDAANVVATHWEPLVEADKVVGLRARLLETAGQAVQCTLQTFRRLSEARRLDLLSQPTGPLRFEGEKVIIDMAEREWIGVELIWESK